MRKSILTAVAILSTGICAFAQETGEILDTTAVNSLLTGLKDNLLSWVTSAVPVVGAIAGGFLIFWLGKVIFRVVKGWANKAG